MCSGSSPRQPLLPTQGSSPLSPKHVLDGLHWGGWSPLGPWEQRGKGGKGHWGTVTLGVTGLLAPPGKAGVSAFAGSWLPPNRHRGPLSVPCRGQEGRAPRDPSVGHSGPSPPESALRGAGESALQGQPLGVQRVPRSLAPARFPHKTTAPLKAGPAPAPGQTPTVSSVSLRVSKLRRQDCPSEAEGGLAERRLPTPPPGPSATP